MIKSVFRYGQLSSTNDEALRLANSGAPHGTIVTAVRQTAGRGRQGRSFFSEEGGSYVTLLLRPQGEPANWLLTTSLAGLAVCDAAAACCGADCRIKWPNDVQLNGKKFCGILTQGFFEGAAILLVGIGCNVAQKTFPPELAEIATSLAIEGYSVSVEQFLNALIRALDHWVGSPPAREQVISDLAKRSSVLGKEILLITPQGKQEALAVGLDPATGGLIVQQGGVRRIITSGEISLRVN